MSGRICGDKIERGRARVDADIRRGTCYVEFGAQPGMDPADPATWWSCMPALGHTILERSVAADFDGGMNLADFEAEYLSQEPLVGTPSWKVVPRTLWDSLADPESSADDVVALAVDATTDQSIASIGVAGLREHDVDRVHIELIDRRVGIEWVVARVVEICARADVAGVAINPSGAASSLIEPLRRALEEESMGDIPVLTPTSREVAQAHARLVSATGLYAARDDDSDAEDPEVRPQRRLSHLGQPEVDRSLGQAASG